MRAGFPISHKGNPARPGRGAIPPGPEGPGFSPKVSVIPAYPGFSLLAVIVVIVLELRVLRTGIFRQKSYWIAMVIIFAFQILVDGWMTKLSVDGWVTKLPERFGGPIVVYNPEVLSGWRWPLDIPTEEFLYAWAMLTLVILLWERAGRKEAGRAKEHGRMQR